MVPCSMRIILLAALTFLSQPYLNYAFLVKSKLQAPFSTCLQIAVPNSLDSLEKLLTASITEMLSALVTGTQRKFYIEMRTPGLNDKIEQSAIVSKDLLFDLTVRAVTPPLLNTFPNLKLLFPSSGDAAGFQAYCRRRGFQLSDNLILTDIALDQVTDSDQCLVIISARNNVGDPVLSVIKSITDRHPSCACLLLNCDLSDRVTTGMTERTVRDAYRASFAPLFYFRNIVSITRPSQIPLERGALLYTPASAAWELHAVDESRIVGPGSLNRFMRTPAFRRDDDDPTDANPPKFALAGSFASMPKRDDIDECLTRASYRIEKLLAKEARTVTTFDGAITLMKRLVQKPSLTDEDREDLQSCFKFLVPLTLSSDVSPAASATDVVVRMGVVDMRVGVQEDPGTAATPATVQHLDTLAGDWLRIHSSSASALDAVLAVVKADGGYKFAGTSSGFLRSVRTGQVLLRGDGRGCTLDFRSKEALFGRSELQYAVEVSVLFVDESSLVLREDSTSTESLWRRVNNRQ